MNVTVNLLKKAILAEDDFGHEMRVRKVLEDVPGATVAHGWTYKDPQEGKPRQFDLRFTLSIPTHHRRFQLAVECKNLAPDAPLVVCGTDRATSESFHHYVRSMVVQQMRHGTMQPVAETVVMRTDGARSYYKPGGFVGKSLLRLKPDSKDTELIRASSAQESEIYGRWSQALASADELCKTSVQHSLRRPGEILTTATLPFVVVPDKTLWQCCYDAGGAPRGDPVSVDHTSFFINHSVGVSIDRYFIGPVSEQYPLTHVHFLTVTGLRSFVQALVGNVPARWEEWFVPS